MDKIDKKLITLLQNNARMPLKALAENVFLSSPAVSARIERLEKEEIIEGYEVRINQLKLGRTGSFSGRSDMQFRLF